MKETPVGKVPDVTAKFGAGKPIDVTVRLPGTAAVNVKVEKLGIDGACNTVSVPAAGPLAAKLPCAA